MLGFLLLHLPPILHNMTHYENSVCCCCARFLADAKPLMDALETSFEKLAEASHALELQQQPFEQPL